MKWLVIAICIAALAYTTKPDQLAHESFVFQEVIVANNLPEKALLDWDDFVFEDMTFFTVSKSLKTEKMVSFGAFTKVFVTDDRWGIIIPADSDE